MASAAYILESIVLTLMCVYFTFTSYQKNLPRLFGSLYIYYVLTLVAMCFNITSCLIYTMETDSTYTTDIGNICDIVGDILCSVSVIMLLVHIHLRKGAAVPNMRRTLFYLVVAFYGLSLVFEILPTSLAKPSSQGFLDLFGNCSYYIYMAIVCFGLIGVLHGIPDLSSGKPSLAFSIRLKLMLVLAMVTVILSAVESFTYLKKNYSASEWFDVLSDFVYFLIPLANFYHPEDFGIDSPKTMLDEPEKQNIVPTL